MDTYYSNGKLLISGEYLVLDGAVSLALPTKFGQSLKIIQTNNSKITWKSYNVKKACWFIAGFDIDNFEIISFSSELDQGDKIAKTLQGILQTAKSINHKFLEKSEGVAVTTHLSFPNEWGLGTSSTLINNIATWAGINAFELLEKSFGGSGYDIACAGHDTAITYQRNGITPIVSELIFTPNFKDQIFFVYLNEKQDSKEGIQMYKSLKTEKIIYIDNINVLTQKMILAKSLNEFELLINQHESLISELLNLKTVREKLFSDFKGAVKSLGAWGGDFVMVTGEENFVKNYFTNKGYKVVLSYDEMILN